LLFVFVAIILQMFGRVLIIAEFKANQNFIAKNLCENRDKPKMNCCGHCYLKKQLKKHDKQEQSTNNFLKEKAETSTQPVDEFHFFTVASQQKISFPTFQFNLSKGAPAAFFHPPCLV
jgi:hypothetical protein